MQFFPPLTGHRERHLNTLVALICGLAGGQRAHLSTSADHAPSGSADQESVIARLAQGAPRWLKHDAHTLDGWFLPVAKALLENLSYQPLLLAIDGSVVGRRKTKSLARRTRVTMACSAGERSTGGCQRSGRMMRGPFCDDGCDRLCYHPSNNT